MTSLGRCTKPRSNSGRMGPSRCTAGKWGLQPLPSEQVPVLHEWLAPLLGALQSVPGAGRTCNGPSCSLCSAGVGRTGVFITLSIVLERMRYEGVVDMFQMVKTLRTQRPAMVQTEVSSPPVHGSGDLWEKRGGLMALGVGPYSPLSLCPHFSRFPRYCLAGPVPAVLQSRTGVPWQLRPLCNVTVLSSSRGGDV